MNNDNELPLTVTNENGNRRDDTPYEESFSYDGYQVVRGEFFAHIFEPSVTFKDEKVSVNAACLNKLPNVNYVQFLVHPDEKKLAVKPCSEETKDSFCWAGKSSNGKRKPKLISCPMFFMKVMMLMGWDPDYRYKVLGKLIRTKTDTIYVFDLTSAETYKRKNSDSATTERKASYPDAWKNQFGLPVKEHQDLTLVSIFDDYTVFRLDKNEESEGKNNEHCNDITRHEEAKTEDPSTDSEDDE